LNKQDLIVKVQTL